jgi:hypothetical protein
MTPSQKNLLSKLMVMFVIPACTSVQSSDVKTAGMTAHMNVSVNGAGASTVSTTLNVDTSVTDFVQLSSGDTLTAKAGTQSEAMTASSILGAVSYSAAFTGESAGGTTYTVDLERASPNTSAASNTVTLPSPITISAPAAAATFSRATGDIVVTYTPSGLSDPVTWTLAGPCINVANGSLTADPGTFTIAHGTLTAPPTPDAGPASACALTLSLTRTHSGTIDPAFEGGSITASQVQTVQLQSTP